MPTYYDVLRVSPSAAPAEIETALDNQYHHWRRLVTHHDPVVVEEAERALRTLEQIRAVLLTPEKRANYDGSIIVGGLADPAASSLNASSVPFAPSTTHDARNSDQLATTQV